MKNKRTVIKNETDKELEEHIQQLNEKAFKEYYPQGVHPEIMH